MIRAAGSWVSRRAAWPCTRYPNGSPIPVDRRGAVRRGFALRTNAARLEGPRRSQPERAGPRQHAEPGLQGRWARGCTSRAGPAGTFWNPANTATGNYTLKATFNLQEPSNHTNYYGLVFGGSNLDAADAGLRLLRDRAERHVHGAAAPGRERHRRGAAARPTPPCGSRAPTASRRTRSKCAWPATPCPTSSTAPWCTPGPKGALKTDGLVGVRVNHVLDVQFEGFEVGK